MSQTPARPGKIPWISVATFSAFALLFAIAYGYLPWLQYNWGFNLLRYSPELIAWSLTAVGALIIFDEARRGLIRAGQALAGSVASGSEGRRDLLVFVLALSLLVLCRERVLLGDSQILAQLLTLDRSWTYPEPGGLFALRFIHDLAPSLGLQPMLSTQLLLCVAGAAAIVFVLRAARLAVPDDRGAGIVPLLVFSGGLFAAVAGRFDTPALAVCASAAYLYLALRYLRGQGELAAPALAFGLAAWLQPLCLFAAPGLLWLPRLAGRRLTAAVGLALVPLLLHTAQLLVFAPKLVPATKVLANAWIGGQAWLRGASNGPSIGTDYVLLSAGHLKYLANAGFVLAPATLPLAALILGLRRRSAMAPPTVRFVVASTLGLVLGSVARRPLWGPFDWDLFAVTGLWIAFLGALLLAGLEARRLRNHIAAAALGLQLCFVGVPLVAVGQGAAVDAGVFFEQKDFDFGLYRIRRPALPRIAPWL